MVHSGSDDVVVSVCLVWCDDGIESSPRDRILYIPDLQYKDRPEDKDQSYIMKAATQTELNPLTILLPSRQLEAMASRRPLHSIEGVV
jgi:hypothetical protein